MNSEANSFPFYEKTIESGDLENPTLLTQKKVNWLTHQCALLINGNMGTIV